MSIAGTMIRINQNDLNTYLNDSSMLLEALLIGLADLRNSNVFYQDYAWHALDFILNEKCNLKSDYPIISKVIYGEKEIDSQQNLGYSSTRYLTSVQVREIGEGLSKIDNILFKSKINSEEMNKYGVYPKGWEIEGRVEFLCNQFTDLKEFYSEANRLSECVLVVFE